MLFTFIIVTYNHEKYILQNLESIKYQIKKHGQNYDFQLIVSDDCSTDNTIEYVNYWVKKSQDLFKYVSITSNDKNQGTCKNYITGLQLSKGDYIKIIAGDDVFPEGNIFDFVNYLNEYDIVMGIPIPFYNNAIDSTTIKSINSLISTELFFEKTSFDKRIRKVCFLTAPGVYLRKELLQNKEVLNFLDKFKVIDDYPQWIKITELYKNISYRFIPKVAVLYRRTSGSVYIVKRNAFYNDIKQLYKYLINNETSIINKIFQYNTLFCFITKSIFIQKYFMLMKYVHVFAKIINYRQTLKISKCIEKEIDINHKYLKNIIKNADKDLFNMDNHKNIGVKLNANIN